MSMSMFTNAGKRSALLTTVVLLAGLSIGCASRQTTYHWGHYQQLVYEMNSKPGSKSPESQVDALNADIQAAKGKGKPVPPGLYVHLGYMQYLSGNQQDALASFQSEATLYPESKVFVERLVTGLGGKTESKPGDKPGTMSGGLKAAGSGLTATAEPSPPSEAPPSPSKLAPPPSPEEPAANPVPASAHVKKKRKHR